MTNTYTPLATVALGGSDTEVIFSNIPNTYRDLIVIIGGSSNGGSSPSLRFNNDANSNYENLRMFATPSTFSSQAFNATYASVGFMNTEQSTIHAQIMDYSATDKHKTVLARGGNTDTIRAEVARWTNNNAINTVAVRFDASQSYNIGTVISLYGVIA